MSESAVVTGDFTPGYFSLFDLPVRGSVAKLAFGIEWWELDQIFKFYLGQFVVITGIPGHGKSTFLFNLVSRLNVFHGIKSFLYVPENEQYIWDKLGNIWGAANAEHFEHFATKSCFIQSAIPDHYDDQPRTIDWVLDKAAAAVRRDKIELMVIDPWNELEYSKPPGLSMTDHIGQSLMKLKQFIRSFNVIAVVVAHPTKSVFDRGTSRTPTLADIDGSMNWYNKCDNGLIVVRENGNQARVISAKVREHGAGRIGACHFTVNPETGIFTPQHGAVST
jgi:twinkle protein